MNHLFNEVMDGEFHSQHPTKTVNLSALNKLANKISVRVIGYQTGKKNVKSLGLP